jgi:hypothetical protein
MEEMFFYNVGKDYILPLLPIFISLFAIFYTRKNVPDYALVSKDGTILSNKMPKYGLFVQKQADQNSCPFYLIRFTNEPEYFEVTTSQGASVEIEQKDNRQYQAYFIKSGLGNPYVECNFKIQAY